MEVAKLRIPDSETDRDARVRGEGGSYNPAEFTMLGGYADAQERARSAEVLQPDAQLRSIHREQPLFRNDMTRVAWAAYPAPEGRKRHKCACYFTCLR